MSYRELIKKVRAYSGLSDDESKDALQLMVESLAVHLPESERKDFASQLPTKLQVIALSVYATKANSQEDILWQFVSMQKVDERRALRQMSAAWKALKDTLSGDKIAGIKSQLPHNTVSLLS
jgi:uncharacterized protein (DUF2267 family)